MKITNDEIKLLEQIKTREELLSRGYTWKQCQNCRGQGTRHHLTQCPSCHGKGGKWLAPITK